jgi:gliding motility-associated-like protein/uncharacterized delta-60 repeat protein
MKTKIILLTLLFMSQFALKAQLVFLDSTFAGPAKGYKTFNKLNAVARAVDVDDLGRIFIACKGNNTASAFSDTIYVIRLKPDGTSSAPGGADTIASIISDPGCYQTLTSLILQPDGKILIGATRANADLDGNDMMVIRLNPDGSRDNTFGVNGRWIRNRPGGAYIVSSVENIALQSNGKIVVSGTIYDYTVNPYTRMFVTRLNANGTEDSNFNSFSSAKLITEYSTGLDVRKDTIVVSGNYIDAQGLPYLSVIKLLPNGNPYTSGMWSGGRVDIPTGSSFNQALGDVAVQPDGDIFVGWSDYNTGFKLTRMLSNGTYTSYPNLGAAYSYLTDVLLDIDGKIILSGYTPITYSYYTAIKVDENGMLDSTFAMNGKFTIAGTGYQSYQSALSKDHKLLMVGQAGYAPGNLPSILKVHISPPIHILGSDYVLPNSSENYFVQVPPGLSNYTFQWTTIGLNVFQFPNATTPRTAKLFFSNSATKAKLICIASPPVGANGGVIMKAEKDIMVNPIPTAAKDLDSLECPQNLTNCSSGYIDYFKLNLIKNGSSGCSNNGYSDYTQSDMIDSLVSGGVYMATMRIPNNGTSTTYIGIWIDYNNDGNFSNIEEFVGEQYTSTTNAEVDIFLKNRDGYDGPKRMRVRTRPDVKLTSTESCPSNGEAGETEDYLIVLTSQPILEAPQVITPNEDGLNDYFVIRGVDPKPDLSRKLTIFDRIGSVLFSSNAYENNWNGTDKNGDKLSPGTYYYVFKNGKNSIKGFLEIRY